MRTKQCDAVISRMRRADMAAAFKKWATEYFEKMVIFMTCQEIQDYHRLVDAAALLLEHEVLP